MNAKINFTLREKYILSHNNDVTTQSINHTNYGLEFILEISLRSELYQFIREKGVTPTKLFSR